MPVTRRSKSRSLMAATESSSARAAAPLGLASATGGEAAAANLVHMETPKSHHLLSSANTNEPGSLNANTNQSARGAESSVKMRMNCTVSTERDGYSKPKASASGANANTNANGTPNIEPAPIIDPSNQAKLIDPLAPTGTGVASMDIGAKSLVTAKPTSPAVASGPSKLLDESPTVGKPSARNDSIKVLDSGFEHADVQPRALGRGLSTDGATVAFTLPHSRKVGNAVGLSSALGGPVAIPAKVKSRAVACSKKTKKTKYLFYFTLDEALQPGRLFRRSHTDRSR